jgi:ANTAR domain
MGQLLDDYIEGVNDALLRNATMAGFLEETAELSAGLFPEGSECAIALERRNRRTVAGASSPRAGRVVSSFLHYRSFVPGPGQRAGVVAGTVWPDGAVASTAEQALPVFATSGAAGPGANATVAVIVPAAGGAGGGVPDMLEASLRSCGEVVRRSLRIACRLTADVELIEDIQRATAERAEIDVAVGALIARQHCTVQDAVAMLRSASSSRNVGVRELAAGIVRELSGPPANNPDQ